MPQFVQQATMYGYDKALPFIDSASKKVPLVQSVLNRFVPYAKPSVQLADKIVDTALGWASKPLGLVQGTVSSVNVKVVACKAGFVTKVSCAKSFATDKLSAGKTVTAETLQKYKALAFKKYKFCKFGGSAILEGLQKYKILAEEKAKQVASCSAVQLRALAGRLHLIELKDMIMAKFAELSSGAHTKLQNLAAWLRLIELRDAACCKGEALKKSVIEMRSMASRKGSAAKKYIIAVMEMAPGKAYSLTARVVGKANIDFVLEMPAKYAPHYTVTKAE